MSTTKFSQEELDQIKNVQNEYQKMIYQFGQLEIERKILDKRKADLDSLYMELLITESALVGKLNDKYGTGTLNVEDGTFTPGQ